jgi:hypothetical protein
MKIVINVVQRVINGIQFVINDNLKGNSRQLDRYPWKHSFIDVPTSLLFKVIVDAMTTRIEMDHVSHRRIISHE